MRQWQEVQALLRNRQVTLPGESRWAEPAVRHKRNLYQCAFGRGPGSARDGR